MISQWQEKNKAIQEESLASTRGSAENIEMYFMHLYRFDMGLEFHYRRLPHVCIEYTILCFDFL